MSSIAANLVAVTVNLARSLAKSTVHQASYLNTKQGRNFSKIVIFPVQSPIVNYQGYYPLLEKVHPFSSLSCEMKSNHSSIHEVINTLIGPINSSPSSSIEEPQENTKEKIDSIHYCSEARKETREGNFEKAEKWYTLAIQEGKNVERIVLAKAFRGDFYREIGQFDKAIKDLREAIQEAPRPRMESFRDLAYTYQDKGELSNAVQILEEGLKSIPNSESLHYELGEICLKMNNAKLALMHLEQVVKYLDHDHWLALNENLYEFLPDIKKIVLQLKNCKDEEASAIYAKLLEARTRFPWHPFYSC